MYIVEIKKDITKRLVGLTISLFLLPLTPKGELNYNCLFKNI